MRGAAISFCLLALCCSFANSLNLKNIKHKAGHGGRKSVVIHTVNPVQRSAWECHPGCKHFCLSSCKRSCCTPGAPNYDPSMFNQLVSYQASLPPPPPPPPACPVGCPESCYPNCDSGCCFQASQPAFPQYPANPYDMGYVGYPAGDPCAAQGCSASCAPLCKPDCCRSQALNLSIRPVYLGGKASPAAPPKPPPKKPPVKTYHKKKPAHKKPSSKTGVICVPQCQRLCKPVCIFRCCLPTHKFHKQSDHKTSHPKPHKPAKVHLDITPVASVQRVPIPKLFALPAPTAEAATQQEPQQSPYAGYPYQDAAAPVAPTAGITCPGSCPLACAPSCQWSCCSPFFAQPAPLTQQPLPYGAVQDSPMDATGTASPGLVPMGTALTSCPAPSCPDTCAPLCSRSCCAGMNLLPQSWDKRNKIPGRV